MKEEKIDKLILNKWTLPFIAGLFAIFWVIPNGICIIIHNLFKKKHE